MSDAPTSSLAPPDFVITAITSVARNGLSVLAGVIGTTCGLSSSQQTQLVGIGISIVLWGTAQLWSLWQHRVHANNANARVAAAATGANP